MSSYKEPKSRTTAYPGRERNPDEHYEVDDVQCIAIVDDNNKLSSNRDPSFLIKWTGYVEETFEPIEHLRGCAKLVKKAMTEVGFSEQQQREILARHCHPCLLQCCRY